MKYLTSAPTPDESQHAPHRPRVGANPDGLFDPAMFFMNKAYSETNPRRLRGTNKTNIKNEGTNERPAKTAL
jgi:hypothetical protein